MDTTAHSSTFGARLATIIAIIALMYGLITPIFLIVRDFQKGDLSPYTNEIKSLANIMKDGCINEPDQNDYDFTIWLHLGAAFIALAIGGRYLVSRAQSTKNIGSENIASEEVSSGPP